MMAGWYQVFFDQRGILPSPIYYLVIALFFGTNQHFFVCSFVYQESPLDLLTCFQYVVLAAADVIISKNSLIIYIFTVNTH